MIVQVGGASRELRGYGDYYDLSGTIPPPSIGTRIHGPYFGTIQPGEAIGVPAVLKAIREIVEPAAALPCMVFRPDGEGSEKARDTWQWSLLHDEPAEGHFPFMFFAHLVSSMLGHGGGIALKIKARGRVWELRSMNSSRIKVCREDGEVRFKVREKTGKTKTLTRDDVLYVPMLLIDDPEIGISPLAAAAQAVRVGLRQQEFEERFYETDGTPSEVIELPGPGWTPEKRREFRESWEARHQPGTRKLGLLWGGASYQEIGVSLNDAEYAEAAKLTERRAKQIFNHPVDKDGEDADRHFREITLQPILTRIEQALKADRDIFPQRDLFVKFLTAALLRPSLKDRADAYRLLRQGGIFTANECRVLEDKPEHEDGNELQATPVGGAPNPRRDGPNRSDDPGGNGRSDEEV